MESNAGKCNTREDGSAKLFTQVARFFQNVTLLVEAYKAAGRLTYRYRSSRKGKT